MPMRRGSLRLTPRARACVKPGCWAAVRRRWRSARSVRVRHCKTCRRSSLNEPARMSLAHVVLIAAAFIAGAQNALAGGGSFLTFPALLYAGLDPRAANIASTIALFPGQVTTSLAGRSMGTGAPVLSVFKLIWISLLGGAVGAFLLLATPVSVFTHM